MEAAHIKELMGQNNPLIMQNDALKVLSALVTEAFVKTGVHRSMSSEQWTTEVEMCSRCLFDDLSQDTKWRNLSKDELSYIFSNGVKGRLTTDKDIVVTYKTFLRWIDGYFSHPAYVEARKEYIVDCKNRMLAEEKKALPPPKSITDDDKRRLVWDAFQSYCDFKRDAESRRNQDASTLMEIVAPVRPSEIYDFSGLRRRYLVERGYAEEGESLSAVFERAISNGGKFLKI